MRWVFGAIILMLLVSMACEPDRRPLMTEALPKPPVVTVEEGETVITWLPTAATLCSDGWQLKQWSSMTHYVKNWHRANPDILILSLTRIDSNQVLITYCIENT